MEYIGQETEQDALAVLIRRQAPLLSFGEC